VDPTHFAKPDPDPHQNEKLDSDPRQSQKQDPDQHQSQNSGALEAQNVIGCNSIRIRIKVNVLFRSVSKRERSDPLQSEKRDPDPHQRNRKEVESVEIESTGKVES
jgi:hypothetical protein